MPTESLTLFCFRDTLQIAKSLKWLCSEQFCMCGCRPREGADQGSRGSKRDRAWPPSLDGVCLPVLIFVTLARDDRVSVQTLSSQGGNLIFQEKELQE